MQPFYTLTFKSNIMKFGYTILYVEQVDSTIEFYQDAFGFVPKFVTPEKDYGELISGETVLAFASHNLGTSNFRTPYLSSKASNAPFGFELAFVSDNIEADFEKAVQAGAVVWEPIKQKPWGQKVGYLRDINGFLIEICSPME